MSFMSKYPSQYTVHLYPDISNHMRFVIRAYLDRHCPGVHAFDDQNSPAVQFLHEGDMRKFSVLFDSQIAPESVHRD